MDLLFRPSIHGSIRRTEIVTSACPSVSPDGKHVAFCRNGDLWLSEVNTSGASDELFQPRATRIWSNYLQESGSDNYSSFIYRISWSPSGKLLAVSTYRYGGSDSGAITILKVGDKAVEKQVVTGHTGVFVDDDHILYSTIGTTGIYLRSLKSGKVMQLASEGYWPMPLPRKT
jgi:Tol biopolymer transport system component